MQSVNSFQDNHSNNDYSLILELVKGALKEAKLLDQIIIEERNEGFFVKPKQIDKQEKIKQFEKLAGTAIAAGEDIKELLDMVSRKDIYPLLP
ncbi:hypothetical protein P9E76_15895 [Schinkia azotoformans]|uniref:Uncharacterized protein n=1 Tax=Schinkia azotoformans LMG 9581 TaxID=1131731 RepID=K6DSM3_SCHAZ|nr:hypothetical protein [Schinkia azotoformans]EKN63786.1 hypothetical protein BAZO_15959 [Schinkia azotoformans LMG 9581]MEC1638043.1 hypothetical protein [Schinkia azotoformans]MEC1946523.1 hypothetical protein [Schinkia azotoformans]